MPDMVFVTNRTNVQLPATPDNPEGGVVVLQPGLNPVPDVAAKNPFMMNLVKASADEVKVAQAAAETQKTVAEAAAKSGQAVSEAQKASLDARMKAGEEWAKAREGAMEKGLPFSDPHPDPVVQQSITLTSEPHAFAAAGMIGKADAPPPAAQQHAPRVTPDTGEHPQQPRSK